MLRIFLCVALFFLPSLISHAHHSTTHFSDEFTEMEGTLVDVHWRNPHVFFSIEVENEGAKKIWEMEAGTIYMIGRAGVTRDLFTVGEQVRVAGNASDVYEDKFWLTNIMGQDGKEILVVAGGEARWTDEVIGGRRNWTNEAFVKEGEAVKGEGIFRVWSPADSGFEPLVTGAPANRLQSIATAASLEAGKSWNPYAFDDACELPGMPRLNFGPHPHQFIQDGDNIIILGEEFHVPRTIDMSADADASTQELSPVGYSIGKWENDNTLVVETTRVNFPYMNLGGIGQTTDVKINERYVLSTDERQVDYEIIITDPTMLTEPYVQRGVWADLGEVISNDTYDCVPKEKSN